jgi:hypothetical protein
VVHVDGRSVPRAAMRFLHAGDDHECPRSRCSQPGSR